MGKVSRNNRNLAVAVVCAVGAFVGLLYLSPGRRSTDYKNAADPGSASVHSEANRQEGKASARTSPGSGRSVERYVEDEMIRSPLSATGVNTEAKVHYKLSDQQSLEISTALREVRTKVVEMIAGSLEESDSGDAAARLLIFRPNKAASAEFREDLHRELSRIAGPEFAESGIRVIDNDFRLLNSGALEIRIEVNPGEFRNAEGIQRVKLTTLTPDHGPAKVWEGAPDVLKEAYWIELKP